MLVLAYLTHLNSNMIMLKSPSKLSRLIDFPLFKFQYDNT